MLLLPATASPPLSSSPLGLWWSVLESLCDPPREGKGPSCSSLCPSPPTPPPARLLRVPPLPQAIHPALAEPSFPRQTGLRSGRLLTLLSWAWQIPLAPGLSTNTIHNARCVTKRAGPTWLLPLPPSQCTVRRLEGRPRPSHDAAACSFDGQPWGLRADVESLWPGPGAMLLCQCEIQRD